MHKNGVLLDIPNWPAVDGVRAQLQTASFEQISQCMRALGREAERNRWLMPAPGGVTEVQVVGGEKGEVWLNMHSLCFDLAFTAARAVGRDEIWGVLGKAVDGASIGIVAQASSREQVQWIRFLIDSVLLGVLTWDLAIESDDTTNGLFPYRSYQPMHRAVLVGAWFGTFGVPEGLTCTRDDYVFPFWPLWPGADAYLRPE